MNVTALDTHPIPLDQEQIDQIWQDLSDPATGDPPSVDTAHDDYAQTIAKRGDWHVFRPTYPFGAGDPVFWNQAAEQGFRVADMEGSWHQLVNVFAEIVDAEGDCRDADYSGGTTQAGSHQQRCDNCGSSWTVG